MPTEIRIRAAAGRRLLFFEENSIEKKDTTMLTLYLQ